MRKWIGIIVFVLCSAICLAEGESVGMQVAESEGMQVVENEGMQVAESVGMQVAESEAMQVVENEGMQVADSVGMQVEENEGMQVAENEGLEHTNVLKVKVGWSYQLDTYLSPLAYPGMQIGIGNEWWQGFRQDTRLGKQGKLVNWAHVGRVDVHGFRNINSARSNMTYAVEASGGWGAFYCWRWFDSSLKVWLGPYLEGSFTARELASNVNKPVSFDISADVMAMSGISWSFYGKKTSYRLNYQIRTNLIGFDFLPDYWESYYELSEGVGGMPRCSGHWNHHSIKHELTMDFQFVHSTWRLGVEHDYLNYGTENMHFIRNQVNLVVGCIWNYRIKANSRL